MTSDQGDLDGYSPTPYHAVRVPGTPRAGGCYGRTVTVIQGRLMAVVEYTTLTNHPDYRGVGNGMTCDPPNHP